MKSIIKTALSLGVLSLLSGCSSGPGGVDEYTLDSVNQNWYNSFKSYRNDTGVVDPVANLRIYQVMVESFQNGDDSINFDTGYGTSSHKGDLQGIINAIPYIKSLGMNAIWMTPVFQTVPKGQKPSELDATGYYIYDYFNVEPRFGTNEKLKELIDTAHKNGLYVFLDGVFGHFRSDVVAKSPKGNTLHMSGKCIGSNLQPYNPPVNTSCTVFDENGDSEKFMTEVATHYIENYKIDGWRLDQAYQVPLDTWRHIKKAVEDTSARVTYKDSNGNDVHPLAYMVGEIWSDNPTITKTGYGSDKEPALDSCFEFGLRYGIVQTLATEEWGKMNHFASNIVDLLKYDENNLPKHAYPNLMITNHDLVRFGDLIQRAGLSESYDRRVDLALSYLAVAHSGPMTNYYGEEIGQEVPGFAAKRNEMGYYDDHVARDNGKISNFTEKELQHQKLFSYLMHLRAQHGSISNGKMELLKISGSLFSIRKTFKGDDTFFYLMNLDKSSTAKITISPEMFPKDKSLKALIGTVPAVKNTDGSYTVTVAPLCFEVVTDGESKGFNE